MAKDTETKITEGFEELVDTIDTAIEEWDRYKDDGVKKGAKNSRKLVLDVKKKAAEIRSDFKDLDL